MAAGFTVPGRPVPKQRPRAGKNGNLYTPKATREYEKAVGWAARQVFSNPYDGPIELILKIYIMARAGDLDNYIKSICDGLNGIAWQDDSQVTRIRADLVIHKKAMERAEVLVRTLKQGA